MHISKCGIWSLFTNPVTYILVHTLLNLTPGEFKPYLWLLPNLVDRTLALKSDAREFKSPLALSPGLTLLPPLPPPKKKEWGSGLETKLMSNLLAGIT